MACLNQLLHVGLTIVEAAGGPAVLSELDSIADFAAGCNARREKRPWSRSLNTAPRSWRITLPLIITVHLAPSQMSKKKASVQLDCFCEHLAVLTSSQNRSNYNENNPSRRKNDGDCCLCCSNTVLGSKSLRADIRPYLIGFRPSNSNNNNNNNTNKKQR